MNAESRRCCEIIADHFGLEKQIKQTLQEFAELQQLLCYRDDQIASDPAYLARIAEEIADVQIMLQQLTYLYHVDCSVQAIQMQKLDRTMGKIRGGGLHG